MWWRRNNWKLLPKITASILSGFVFFASIITSPSVETANLSYDRDPYVSSEQIQSVSTDNLPSDLILGISAETIGFDFIGSKSEQNQQPTETNVDFATSPVIVPSATHDAVNPDIYASTAGEMKVHFLDIGQGAATLFEIGDKTMLIDGGDRDKSSFVVSYLKEIGVSQIDVMIATHYDVDHINGLVGAINVFPVGQVYDPDYVGDSRVYNSYKNYIDDHDLIESNPVFGQTIQVGNATVVFVAPKFYGHDEFNDDSLCVRILFGQTSFLIMGDPSANAEQQILTQDLESDVYLASHHGSNGSNSKTLLAKASPKFVVISCGAGNPYGHPGHNTMSRIESTGASLFRTDKQGTIICTSDGISITWEKVPCNDYSPGVEITQ